MTIASDDDSVDDVLASVVAVDGDDDTVDETLSGFLDDDDDGSILNVDAEPDDDPVWLVEDGP